MRGVQAFLVWLFSIWTWFKACFRRRWFKTPRLEQARLGTNAGSEQLRFDKLALCSKFPAESLALACELNNDRCKLRVHALQDGEWIEESVSGGETTFREFLVRIASSVFVCAGRLTIRITGDETWKHFGELVEALLSNTNFGSITIRWGTLDDKNPDTQVSGEEINDSLSVIRISECVSHLLLGNDVIQNLRLVFENIRQKSVIGKGAAEPLAKALCKNRQLRKLELFYFCVTEEGMEMLVKPLTETDSVLETLDFFVGVTDAGLEHLGVMLCTNTSLKTLRCGTFQDKVYQRGFTSLRDALCCNKVLEDLTVFNITSSVELELLLEPLTSMNETTQANTTLTSLHLWQGTIGGEEGGKS